jgi:hypothetical protein
MASSAVPLIRTTYWCERVQTCFSLFLSQPNTLHHLLLFGPPGSGKTTSAAWLVEKIWGNRKSLMCMSMNAADERSLESIRQKVFPFLSVDWRTEEDIAPRFLILDECETLTEAAQLSLQTILTTDPKELCVILICNSQSRIHPKLRQRLLKIRYDPPTTAQHESSTLFSTLTRGDLRQMDRKVSTEARLWAYLHAHPSEYPALLRSSDMDYSLFLTELLLLAELLGVMDVPFLQELNTMYPFLSDASPLSSEVERRFLSLLRGFKEKIECASRPGVGNDTLSPIH